VSSKASFEKMFGVIRRSYVKRSWPWNST